MVIINIITHIVIINVITQIVNINMIILRFSSKTGTPTYLSERVS